MEFQPLRISNYRRIEVIKYSGGKKASNSASMAYHSIHFSVSKPFPLQSIEKNKANWQLFWYRFSMNHLFDNLCSQQSLRCHLIYFVVSMETIIVFCMSNNLWLLPVRAIRRVTKPQIVSNFQSIWALNCVHSYNSQIDCQTNQKIHFNAKKIHSQ